MPEKERRTCPECGKVLKDARGMRLHRKLAHDEEGKKQQVRNRLRRIQAEAESKPVQETEKGVEPLAENKESVGLTKEAFKQMFEEVLKEKASEDERKAAMEAAIAAVEDSKVAKDLATDNAEKIGQVCQGVECIKQSIDEIQAGFKKMLDEAQASDEPVEVAPQPAPPPPTTQPPAQAHEEEREHRHRHPEHLISRDMALGVLDRIMSCDVCSPQMKDAMAMRMQEYFPEYFKEVESADAGSKPSEPDQVGSGSKEEPSEAEAETKAEAEDEKVGAPAREEASNTDEAAAEPTPASAPTAEPAAATAGDEPTGADDAATATEPAAAESGEAPAPEPADGGENGYNDPLGFI